MPINIEKYNFLAGLERDTAFKFEGLKIAILEEIVKAMKTKGISRADLSRKLGTSRAYITRMLRADINFTLMKLVQIAQALETELDVRFHIPNTKARRIDIKASKQLK